MASCLDHLISYLTQAKHSILRETQYTLLLLLQRFVFLILVGLKVVCCKIF